MKKYIHLAIVTIITIIILGSCKKENSEAQKIILEMSKCTRYQSQHFLLFALIHLSPIAGARKGAMHTSAGYTAVQLSIKTGELSYQSFSLSTEANHTTSSPANDTLLNGYTIRLVKVLHYPNIDMPQPVEYRE
ncbi:MAG: hypothetical protein IPM10_11805 [Chitinophagaceae bacterium]|nr:hypothetical protein [Chitinophagaceae bacterium]